MKTRIKKIIDWLLYIELWIDNPSPKPFGPEAISIKINRFTGEVISQRAVSLPPEHYNCRCAIVDVAEYASDATRFV